MFKLITCAGLLIVGAAGFAFAQHAEPKQTIEIDRQHRRIAQVEMPGRRIELTTVKGARLFAGPQLVTERAVPLIVHFHGATWLVETHIARNVPRAALITVNLGTGSSVYGRPFEREETFRDLVDEARRALGLKHEWSSVTLTGFSAGYGAVRAILRHGQFFRMVNNVLLLDGMHASYLPEPAVPSGHSRIKDEDVEPFVRFAREAASGRKGFVFSHSEIKPGTYASTTECADHLLAKLGILRKPDTKTEPGGMRRLSMVRTGRLYVFGYAGDTAADHIDHLHAMPVWLNLLRLK